MSDDTERSKLPWVLAALVLVIGGAKLEAARPLVARILALAIPVVPVALGVKRVEDGDATLDRAASAVGWVVILAGETCVAASVFHVGVLADLAPVARLALYGAGVAALWVHALEGRSAGKARFAGYVGIAAGFAVYVSTHVGKDMFSSVFGAFFVGFFIGGGAGLLLGELLVRGLKKA